MASKRPQPKSQVRVQAAHKPGARGKAAPSRHRLLKRCVGFTVLAGAFLLAFFIVTSAGIYAYYGRRFEPPDQVAINAPAGGAKVFDRNGNLLYQFIDDREGLRVPLQLKDISDNLVAATIATEDDSFYTNQGVNTKGLARAVWQNFNPLSGHFLDGSGGSSITQQLIKRVYFPPEKQISRAPDRKFTEIVYAIKLTDEFSKDQILTWYLNQINYGGVYNGVEAASRGYFNKPAKELTLSEAALLAGLPQAPAYYNPLQYPEAALARRNDVLELMASHGRLQLNGRTFSVDRAAIEAAKKAPLGVVQQQFPIEAPHFVLSYVQPELEARFGRDALFHEGLQITTTIDAPLQRKTNAILEQYIQQFEEQSNSHNGAVTVIDPNTGEILVMIGSRDYFRDDIQGQVNNAIAPNSPGSTFKPFVYLDAFTKLNWGPGTLIDDSPVSYKEADGSVFSPSNPLHDYHGMVTLRSALGNSLNIPAFKAAQAVTVPEVVSFGRKVGLTEINGSYGPAIAIGGIDVSQVDLAYAYSVLASGGMMRGQAPVTPHKNGERGIDPIAVLKVTDRNGKTIWDVKDQRKQAQIASPQQAFLISSILSDSQAVCLTFGCGGLNVPGVTAAVKTGTSEPFDPKGPNAGKIGDTWAFGYTPDVVVGVWAGNSDNAPVTNILSTSIAFRSMRDTLVEYFKNRKPTAFAVPTGVVKGPICQTAGGSGLTRTCSSTVTDYYVQGSAPTVSAGLAAPSPTPQRAPQQPPANQQPQAKPSPTPKPGNSNNLNNSNNGNNGTQPKDDKKNN